MTKKTIMLVCAAGMSTSLLVQKMKNAAQKENLDVNIFATAASETDKKVTSENPDILMLGPQVRYLEGGFKKKYPFPVVVIDMRAYGTMDGKKVLTTALNLIDNK